MYVRVHVVADAKRESVTKKSDTEFYITVQEPAERNMANKRIHILLAREFNIPQAQVKMLTGHRSSTKMYSVEKGD